MDDEKTPTPTKRRTRATILILITLLSGTPESSPKVDIYTPKQKYKMAAPTNSIETYCTFTLAADVTAGGLPSEEDIAKDLESSDDNVRGFW